MGGWHWNRPRVEKLIVARSATGQEVCHILWSNCASCWSPVEACCEPDESSSHLHTLFLRSSIIARPRLDHRFGFSDPNDAFLKSAMRSSFLSHLIILFLIGVIIWDRTAKFEVADYKFAVKFLGTEVPCTLGWHYIEGTWLYCDIFHLVCISYCGCFNLFCNMWVCRRGVCNVWVCVCMGSVMCGCFDNCGGFGNMCTCIYCVLYCSCCFVLFRVCVFILICI
jgi:hypothetical protein